jgi:hypothetical protein
MEPNKTLTCPNCNEEKTDVIHNIPTGVHDTGMGEVMTFTKICFGCFVEYSGFDNEGRPAVVQLLEA